MQHIKALSGLLLTGMVLGTLTACAAHPNDASKAPVDGMPGSSMTQPGTQSGVSEKSLRSPSDPSQFQQKALGNPVNNAATSDTSTGDDPQAATMTGKTP